MQCDCKNRQTYSSGWGHEKISIVKLVYKSTNQLVFINKIDLDDLEVFCSVMLIT